MGVKHDSLAVLDVIGVLEGPSVETDLFAHFGNSFLVVVCEEFELEDTFCDIGRTHEVNFEQLGLQMTLVWTVPLECFK